MHFLKAGAALAGVLTLAACADRPRPAGEIEYSGELAGLGVGEAVNLRWSAVRADRVYVRPVIDGEEGALLDAGGFDPVGSTSFTIDPNAVKFATDDDTASVKFQLLVRETGGDADDFEVLDETLAVEIANAP